MYHSSNFKGIIDTVKYEYAIGEDDYCINLTPDGIYNSCGTYYWGDLSSIQYNFDDAKITELKEFRINTFGQCDTTSITKTCLIIEKEETEEFIKRKQSKITEVIKYYITEQQYELADSI